MITVGVLALQGAIAEHINCLKKLPAVTVREVKTLADLNSIDGLILPGGESTAMGKILNYFNLLEPIAQKIKDGLPVWGTCAGMILLAKNISNQTETYFATMDITVKRNAYGSQLDSFQTDINLPAISNNPIPLIFIRAPYIEVAQEHVEVLAKIDNNIVAAKQDNMLVTSFHPELTQDLSWHKYFGNMILHK